MDDDPYLQLLIVRAMIAKEWGWTLEYVDGLVDDELSVLFGILEGQERYRKFADAKAKAQRR